MDTSLGRLSNQSISIMRHSWQMATDQQAQAAVCGSDMQSAKRTICHSYCLAHCIMLSMIRSLHCRKDPSGQQFSSPQPECLSRNAYHTHLHEC